MVLSVVPVPRWSEFYFRSGRRTSLDYHGCLRFISITFQCRRLDWFQLAITVKGEFVLREAFAVVAFWSSVLRPSTRRSRCRISVSRAFVEDEGTQRSSLLSCLSRAEPRRLAWLRGFRGSQAIGLRIGDSQVEEIGHEGLQTQ